MKLNQFIKEYSCKNKESLDIPVYSVTNSAGFCKDYFNKDVSSKEKSNYKLVPYGFFAYNPSRINVGSVDCQLKEKLVQVSPLYNVFSCSDKILNKYLLYYLKSKYCNEMINAKTNGSVRSNLKIETLSEFDIFVPKLDKQKLIIDELDEISLQIEKSQKLIKSLDELIKSRFIEMFGDVNYSDKYNRVFWNDVVKIINGRDYKKIQVEEGGYPVYGTGGEMARCSNYLCPENTIIVGRKGTINNPLLVKEKFWNVDTAFGVVPGSKLNYLYFYWFCKQFDFSSLNKQAVLPSTTKSDLLKIKICLPPINLQNEFASFVELIDKSKFSVQKEIELYQELLDKKMDEYFG